MSRIWLASLLSLLAAGASAAPVALTYDSLRESKTVVSRLLPGSPIAIEGRLDNSGAFVDTLTFVAGSSSVSMSAGWLVAPPSNRTIGVNIDLFDGLNNLVVSDTFIGINGSLATSQFTAGGLIAAANYRMVLTGTAVGTGRFRIDLADGATPPALAPVLPFTPDPTRLLFDTHSGAKAGTTLIAAGGALLIDGALRADGGKAIVNSTTIRVTSDALSAGIVWIVGTLDDPQRTVGVNVDLFDFNHVLVDSDSFVGLTGGQAFSQFTALGLVPGDYELVFTGTGVNDLARYRINLVGDATAPRFQPIGDPPPNNGVPEPSSVLLVTAGAALLVFVRGRREPVARTHC